MTSTITEPQVMHLDSDVSNIEIGRFYSDSEITFCNEDGRLMIKSGDSILGYHTYTPESAAESIKSVVQHHELVDYNTPNGYTYKGVNFILNRETNLPQIVHVFFSKEEGNTSQIPNGTPIEGFAQFGKLLILFPNGEVRPIAKNSAFQVAFADRFIAGRRDPEFIEAVLNPLINLSTFEVTTVGALAHAARVSSPSIIGKVIEHCIRTKIEKEIDLGEWLLSSNLYKLVDNFGGFIVDGILRGLGTNLAGSQQTFLENSVNGYLDHRMDQILAGLQSTEEIELIQKVLTEQPELLIPVLDYFPRIKALLLSDPNQDKYKALKRLGIVHIEGNKLVITEEYEVEEPIADPKQPKKITKKVKFLSNLNLLGTPKESIFLRI